MFSCFCTNRNKPKPLKPSLKQQNNILQEQTSKSIQNQSHLIQASTTMETPPLIRNVNMNALNIPQQANSINSSGQRVKKTRGITSIKEFENESSENENKEKEQEEDEQQFLSDESVLNSDTVPYKNMFQLSDMTATKNNQKNNLLTEGAYKHNHRHNGNSNLYHSNLKHKHPVNNQPKDEEEIKRYFSYDKEIMFNSKHLNPMNRDFTKLSLAYPTIDYSRYSQIDRQVSSNQILDLDEEMENRLKQLENQPPPFQKVLEEKSYESHSLTNIKILLTSSRHVTPEKNKVKDNSRFQKLKKLENIENIENIEKDFDELQRAQRQISNRLYYNPKLTPRTHNKKIMKTQNGRKLLKNFHEQIQKKKSQEIQAEQQEKKVQSMLKLIQNSVTSQLQSIIDQNIYFSYQEALQAPQDLSHFRKIIKTDEDDTQIINETLQQAENAFHCSSINEEFTRAVINHHLDLALKIFQKMTPSQKNTKDLKGYVPVHVAVLSAITNDKCFEFAKKLIYHPDVRLDVQGPTGWSPLQEVISYKHIRLSPNLFVAAHRKKLGLIRDTVEESSKALSEMRDFYLQLDVKVDSFIPLVNTITPQDKIKITKIGESLLIDYTLVGYEYLSCKRRDMGFLLAGKSIYALNRSKQIYCDLLQQLDKQEIQMLVVQSLQTQTKKIDPQVNKIDIKKAKSIFDNQITDVINSYKAKKFTFSIDYTSKTEKRMPEKLTATRGKNLQQPLAHISSWQNYLKYQPKINIKPKNKNKKIQLQLWLSQDFSFQIQHLLKIFDLFSLCNPLAKIISTFLNQNFSSFNEFQNYFPVKIDIPINFSLYFNLEFKGLKFQNFSKNTLEIDPNLKKCSRKQFQNIAQSKQKRAFAISAFT